MNVFIDANVIIAVLNKEYPLFTYAARVLSLSENKKFKLYTSPLCLAIAFYFSSKKSGEESAKKKIGLMAQYLHLAAISEKCVQNALENKMIHDLEDGFQYYAALENDCKYIVTEDVGDFYFSEIEVFTSENFLEKYVF